MACSLAFIAGPEDTVFVDYDLLVCVLDAFDRIVNGGGYIHLFPDLILVSDRPIFAVQMKYRRTSRRYDQYGRLLGVVSFRTPFRRYILSKGATRAEEQHH